MLHERVFEKSVFSSTFQVAAKKLLRYSGIPHEVCQ